MSIETIINYINVSERIASSGQPDREQFSAIAKAGYEIVINLAMPDSDNAIADEENIVTDLNMLYFHLPVPFDSPNTRHLERFIEIMNSCSGKKKWIHCALNYRVSAFLYQYWRLVKGAGETAARKVMLPCWEPDDVWQDFMNIGGIEPGPARP